MSLVQSVIDWKKSAEQLQAEAAYLLLTARIQEQQQARERAERMARDYHAGILYVTEVKECEKEAEVGNG